MCVPLAEGYDVLKFKASFLRIAKFDLGETATGGSLKAVL